MDEVFKNPSAKLGSLLEAKKIHFVGIGGIGISAIARMLLLQGKKVSGSDISESKIIEELKNLGAEIYIGHKKENLSEDTDLVVYTIASDKDNPELVFAREKNIPIISYPESLGIVSSEKFTIAISGAHGKTTTTAMIADILIDAGMDPTVIVGSLMQNPQDGKQSNFIEGKGNYFVVEACEYRRSFLNLNPNILAITNIDEDHLDYYKDLSDIQSAFRELALKVPEDGFVICDKKNSRLAPVIEGLECKIIDYKEFPEEKIKLGIPGQYNKENALTALASAEALGIDLNVSLRALEKFKGTWRRFELVKEDLKGNLFYDDYAHSPAEIRAFLSALREKFPSNEIVAVFQPHLYSRTKILLDDFTQSFSLADEVILVPVYPAREEPNQGVGSDVLAQKMSEFHPKVKLAKSLDEASKLLVDKISTEKDKVKVFVTVGAGDVFKVFGKILED